MTVLAAFALLLVVAQEPGCATLDSGVNETARRQEPGNEPLQSPRKTGITGNPAAVLSVPTDSEHHLNVVQGAESVLLPCAQVNMSNASVTVWALKEGSGIVHIHTLDKGGGRGAEGPRYRGRTLMRSDALQSGNLSLTLVNPTTNDSGDYTCTVREFGLERSETQVRLTVEVKDPPNLTGIIVGSVVAVVAVGLIAYFIYIKRFKKVTARPPPPPIADVVGDNAEGQQLRAWPLEAESGAVSLRLPSGVTSTLPASFRVEWKTAEKEIVHVYAAQPEVQDKNYRDREVHWDYKNRTEMDHETFDLTLKHLRKRDSTTYICTVKDGTAVEKHEVELKVKDAVVEVESGAKSVLLPYETTADLPDRAVVKWYHEKGEKDDPCIHIYPWSPEQHKGYEDRTKMNDEQPLSTGDLGVILDDPTYGESGTYSCRVYDQEGVFLREKTINLKVPNPESRMMVPPLPPGEEEEIPLMSERSVMIPTDQPLDN